MTLKRASKRIELDTDEGGISVVENSKALQQAEGPSDSVMELVIATGDLGKLTPAARLSYYRSVCGSLGLNPMTRPFQYITLNGKLTLYATRDCTDQLRATRKVSLEIMDRKREDDIYTVRARATLPDGRTDESTGVVCLTGKRGDDLANLLMKCETKAKRRVTLSIVGLGWIDETETETVPGARLVPVDMETGEIMDASDAQEGQPDEPESQVAPETKPDRKALEGMIKARREALRWTLADLDAVCRSKFKVGLRNLPDDTLPALVDLLNDYEPAEIGQGAK